MGDYVFVSYSRQDIDFVRELLRFLRGHGLKVWADDQLAVGERWDRVIRMRIAECAAFILVMSPSADKSDWVAAEIDYARNERKPILPLLLDGEIFFGFSRTQHHSVVGGMLPGPDLIAQLHALVAPETGDPTRPSGNPYDRMDHVRFRRKLRQCSEVFGRILPTLKMQADDRRAYASVEIDLIDSDGLPVMRNHDVVARVADPTVAEELAKFNVEFEIPAVALGPHFLAESRTALHAKLDAVRRAANELGVELALTGILPTLMPGHTTTANLSEPLRYRWLNDLVLQERHEDVRLDIAGDESIRLDFDSIAVEAACTSSKFFIETAPTEFAAYWNASSAVAAVQIAAGANSPFLFGRRLWSETRVPLFEQAVDTRPPELAVQGVRPRAWFGDAWLGSLLDLFEENNRYFPALLPICEDQDPHDQLAAGELPPLTELRLHNGTIYRWNRAQYTVDLEVGRGRVFLENRVLPTGPTVADMVANIAFYLGLITELGSANQPVWGRMPFAAAHKNFRTACRLGISSELVWPGLGTIDVVKLINKYLIPVAHAGLARLGINSADQDRYLGIVEDRCAARRNGAVWQTETVADLEKHGKSRSDALREMTLRYIDLARTDEPVHTWPIT